MASGVFSLNGPQTLYVQKALVAPLDLFRDHPELLNEKSYDVKTRVGIDVWQGFCQSLFDSGAIVDVNLTNVDQYRALAQELGFHGLDDQIASVPAPSASATAGTCSADMEVYRRQIAAQEERIASLERQLALLRSEFQRNFASKADLKMVNERVDELEIHLQDVEDSVAEQEQQISVLQDLTDVTARVPQPVGGSGAGGSVTTTGKRVESVVSSLDQASFIDLSGIEANMSLAQFVYGLCSEFQFGIERSLSEAVNFYKAAADQGNAYGQLCYGRCLREGKGIDANPHAAFSYFEKAAKQGNSTAMFYCGLDREDKRIESEAAKWFRQSADLGNAAGQCGYGRCLERGFGVDRDLKEAAKYYSLSAQQKNALGQVKYGICLQEGIGVVKDLREAASYFKLAALQGFPEGQLMYGKCLAEGSGVKRDPVLAVRYYRMASEKGNAEAQVTYGLCLLNGEGVARDLAEAARLFQLAADQWNIRGQIEYAKCLGWGRGVVKNVEMATRKFREAANTQNAEAQYNYALFLEQVSTTSMDGTTARLIAENYGHAADQGLPDAINGFGRCLERGIGVTADMNKAAERYAQAAEVGSIEGKYNYARFLLSGQGNVSKDIRQAVALFREAANAGHTESQTELEKILATRPELGRASVSLR